MMAIGAITLIALILPGEGALTDWWRDSIAPWFETGRWLLPFLLLGGGWYVAAGPGTQPGSGWGMTLGGLGPGLCGRSRRVRDPDRRHRSTTSAAAAGSAASWPATSSRC